MNDTGHWICEKFESDAFGFIYIITNLKNNRKYIGKKQCISKTKRKPLKGRTNKRIVLKESDWKIYTSSSNDLNLDIQKFGKEKFVFKILKTCNSKWELAYYEIKEQLDRNVLLRNDFYNGIINVRIGRPPKNFKDSIDLNI